jgi:hypothetical protein
MDAVFNSFVHSTRSSNHDVWRIGTRLAHRHSFGGLAIVLIAITAAYTAGFAN